MAVWACSGNISGKGLSIPDMLWPMGFFLGGLALCGFAFFLSYRTQYILYQEIMGGLQKQQRHRHIIWLRLASIFALLSLIAFVIGSFLAVIWFQSPSSYISPKVESTLLIISPKADS